MHARPGKMALPGIVRCKCVILVFFCMLSSALCSPALADGITVRKVDTRLEENGYQLFASYDITLTAAAKHALTRGIPLYFVCEYLLTRSRWYWLDEEIFQGVQTIKLSYSVLTRQYRISRGALFQNFASFDDALNMLTRQSSDIIPAQLIQNDGDYVAATRLRLDIEQLPLPLQVNALTGKDWALNSDWYRWAVTRPETAVREEVRAE